MVIRHDTTFSPHLTSSQRNATQSNPTQRNPPNHSKTPIIRRTQRPQTLAREPKAARALDGAVVAHDRGHGRDAFRLPARARRVHGRHRFARAVARREDAEGADGVGADGRGLPDLVAEDGGGRGRGVAFVLGDCCCCCCCCGGGDADGGGGGGAV